LSRDALFELRKIAKQRHSRLITTDKVRTTRVAEEEHGFQIADIHTENASYEDLRIPLLGKYQLRNSTVAITAIERLQTKGIFATLPAIRRGFERVQHLTGIRGRFEILQSRPLIILDVGHNPDAVSATVDSLRGIEYRKLLLVFGVMKDKDYRSMIRILAALKPAVFAVQPGTERALSAAVIADIFRKLNCQAHSWGGVAEGIREALRTQKKNDLLLICGSHYVVGEALGVFPGRPYRKSS